MAVKELAITCDWCEAQAVFETEEEAYEAAWIHLETNGGQYDYCSTDCLISDL